MLGILMLGVNVSCRSILSLVPSGIQPPLNEWKPNTLLGLIKESYNPSKDANKNLP